MKLAFLPKIVRIGEATAYLGMSRTLSDRQVQLWIFLVRIGNQGLQVDRYEIGAWAKLCKRIVGDGETTSYRQVASLGSIADQSRN